MRIHIKLFAGLREAAGAAELEIELPDGATAGSVRQVVAEKFPAIVGQMRGTALAVNQAYADPQTVLRDGDELALLPPVSGG